VAAYARKRLPWPCEERAKEIAQDAVAYACARGVPPEAAERVEAASYLLRGIVNGLIANERRRRSGREQLVASEALERVAGGASPEELLVAREERALIAAMLHECVEGDAVLEPLLGLLVDEVEDAASQAIALSLPIPAVRNAHKRLNRAVRARDVRSGLSR
jgi:hypothetical protein